MTTGVPFTSLADLVRSQERSSVRAAGEQGVGKHYVDQTAFDDSILAQTNRLFLPLAIAHVGRATDPKWSDWERTTLYYPSPAVQSEVTVSQILARYPPPLPSGTSLANIASMGAVASPSSILLTYDEQLSDYQTQAPAREEAARREVAAEQACYENWCRGIEEHREGIEALHSAFRRLAQSVLDEKVEVFVRPSQGGKMQLVDPTTFSRSDIITPATRFGVYEAQEGSFHLFADAEQLENAFPLPSSSNSGLEAFAGVHLSPYLRIMLDVAQRSGVSPYNQVKTESLKAEIQASAHRHGVSCGAREQLSTRNVGVMATFLREPLEK
jgi:hypothetical protein